jgi:hypothetical protein
MYMADTLPLKPVYTGTDPTAIAEFQSGDTLLLPDGGVKFQDGTSQNTASQFRVINGAPEYYDPDAGEWKPFGAVWA